MYLCFDQQISTIRRFAICGLCLVAYCTPPSNNQCILLILNFLYVDLFILGTVYQTVAHLPNLINCSENKALPRYFCNCCLSLLPLRC